MDKDYFVTGRMLDFMCIIVWTSKHNWINIFLLITFLGAQHSSPLYTPLVFSFPKTEACALATLITCMGRLESLLKYLCRRLSIDPFRDGAVKSVIVEVEVSRLVLIKLYKKASHS